MNERRRSHSRRGLLTPYWLGAAVLLLGCGVLSLALMSGPVREWVLGPPIPTAAVSGLLSQATVPGDPAASCRRLIERAIQTSDESCSQIGSNKVCYGNTTLQARLAPGAAGRFEQKGDVIDVGALQALSAAPMDLERQEWGIAIFKLLANLPRTLPGENVTFIVFGNTTLSSGGDSLEAFYFSSGAGRVACEAVPFDGILVEMPDGAGMTLAVNGAQVTLMGQAALQAAVNGSMTVSVLKGSARVSAAGGERFFGAGHQVSVPLAGVGGVEASGPPSEPQPLPEAVLQVSCTFTGSACSPADVTPVSPLEAQAAVYAAAGAGAQVALAATSTVPVEAPSAESPSHTPSPSLAFTSTGVPPSPSPRPSGALGERQTGNTRPTAAASATSPAAPTAALVQTNTQPPLPTGTQPPALTPTSTNVQVNTPLPTATATPTGTSNPLPTATSTSTNTEIPPTATATTPPTDLPTATPFPTQTNPPLPSETPTALPSETPLPTDTATAAPTTETCSIASGALRIDDKDLEWRIQNNMSSTITIQTAVIFWPETPHSQELRDMYLGSEKIWSGDSERSPTSLPAEGGWQRSEDDRRIRPGSDRTVRFKFKEELRSGGYTVTITFDNGCAATASS